MELSEQEQDCTLGKSLVFFFSCFGQNINIQTSSVCTAVPVMVGPRVISFLGPPALTNSHLASSFPIEPSSSCDIQAVEYLPQTTHNSLLPSPSIVLFMLFHFILLYISCILLPMSFSYVTVSVWMHLSLNACGNLSSQLWYTNFLGFKMCSSRPMFVYTHTHTHTACVYSHLYICFKGFQSWH